MRAALGKLLTLSMVAGVLSAALFFPVAGGLGLLSNQVVAAVGQTSVELANVDPPAVTTIQDKDGKPLAYLWEQDRVNLRPDQISDAMKAAILAIEDRRFYDHNGVDFQGTVGAGLKGLIKGSIAGGGSTLTQQYVKNFLAFVVSKDVKEGYRKATEQSASRKIKEVRLALDLERRLAESGMSHKQVKEEILTRYLNIVPFLYDIYGVGEAARAYFDTTADKLTVPQAALFAAMVNNPQLYNPYANYEKAKRRRNIVINQMAEQGMLSPNGPEENKRLAEEYRNTEIELAYKARPAARPRGCLNAVDAEGKPDHTYGFFCEYVVDYLKKAGFTDEQLNRGGLTIRTTMDRKAMEAAKEAATNKIPQTRPGVANVMSVIEPGTGRHPVRALVANRDYGLDKQKGERAFDLPTQYVGFGAGSIFKVFVAAAYLQQGGRISDRIPVGETYTSRVYKGNGNAPYTVKNAGTYPAQMTVQDALAQSPNTAFVRMQEKVGLEKAAEMAYKLGLRESMRGINMQGKPLKPDGSNGPSVLDAVVRGNLGTFTLGVTPVSPLELSNVAATIASGGMWCPPTPIEQVTDRDGKPVPVKEASCERAVDEDLANSLAQGLSKDDKPGGTSATAAGAAGWTREILGKTGTTEEYKSSGFLAATPQYAGAVLVFSDSDRPETVCKNGRTCGTSTVNGAFGGDLAAPTWFEAMKKIHEGLREKTFPPAAPRYR
ncbi:transglycosylase domain-containing protein [Longimycelium tulufanense]|uniref:transglycosylase domain-containing protein n=1 Tax=Longimycelium tulufanense TaxID=907463 RepID=UPI001E2F63B2|nr:transglycosylase domain-containing protein [Longimycelium tulufanense]